MTELQGHEDRLEIGADSGVFVRSRAEGSHGRSRVGGSAVQHPHCAREQGATNRTHGISIQGRLDEGGDVQPLVAVVAERDRPLTLGRPHPDGGSWLLWHQANQSVTWTWD